MVNIAANLVKNIRPTWIWQVKFCVCVWKDYSNQTSENCVQKLKTNYCNCLYIIIANFIVLFFLALRSNSGLGLIFKVSRKHTTRHTNTHRDSVALLWTCDQPLVQAANYSTHNKNKTKINAFSGIFLQLLDRYLIFQLYTLHIQN